MNEQNQFTMPESDVTVKATFVMNLETAKEYTKNAIDELVPADASDELKAAAKKAKDAVDAAKTMDEIDAACDEFSKAYDFLQDKEELIAELEEGLKSDKYSDAFKALVEEILDAVKADSKALVVTPAMDEIIVKSARNIPGVETCMANLMNVYDILKEKGSFAGDVDLLIHEVGTESVFEVVVLWGAERMHIGIGAVVICDQKTFLGYHAACAAEVQGNDCVAKRHVICVIDVFCVQPAAFVLHVLHECLTNGVDHPHPFIREG